MKGLEISISFGTFRRNDMTSLLLVYIVVVHKCHYSHDNNIKNIQITLHYVYYTLSSLLQILSSLNIVIPMTLLLGIFSDGVSSLQNPPPPPTRKTSTSSRTHDAPVLGQFTFFLPLRSFNLFFNSSSETSFLLGTIPKG